MNDKTKSFYWLNSLRDEVFKWLKLEQQKSNAHIFGYNKNDNESERGAHKKKVARGRQLCRKAILNMLNMDGHVVETVPKTAKERMKMK